MMRDISIYGFFPGHIKRNASYCEIKKNNKETHTLFWPLQMTSPVMSQVEENVWVYSLQAGLWCSSRKMKHYTVAQPVYYPVLSVNTFKILSVCHKVEQAL